MATKIIVPELGESIVEATVGKWLKKAGDRVSVGEVLVSLETEKVDLEVGAEKSGVLTRLERQEGETVKIGETLGVIEDGPGLGVDSRARGNDGAEKTVTDKKLDSRLPEPEFGKGRGNDLAVTGNDIAASDMSAGSKRMVTPLAKRMAEEHGLDVDKISSGDPSGRVRREDVENYLKGLGVAAVDEKAVTGNPALAGMAATAPAPPLPPARKEERVRLSRRRLTIARRLVEAQRTAAMLTTFNEADMSAVMALRQRHKESFKERHGVSLGIASFFVKACVAALREFPKLNAEIQGEEMVLKRYYDIGMAVGAAKGLVVPVLRDADQMSFSQIEKAIKNFARQAEESTLSLEDLRGGTFTITNGGVFGSLFSTPILNPPQVGILGLHKIQERPVNAGGQVAIHPMMYVALSYDHRLVDGMEAVQFLARIKEMVEDPAGLLLEA